MAIDSSDWLLGPASDACRACRGPANGTHCYFCAATADALRSDIARRLGAPELVRDDALDQLVGEIRYGLLRGPIFDRYSAIAAERGGAPRAEA